MGFWWGSLGVSFVALIVKVGAACCAGVSEVVVGASLARLVCPDAGARMQGEQVLINHRYIGGEVGLVGPWKHEWRIWRVWRFC